MVALPDSPPSVPEQSHDPPPAPEESNNPVSTSLTLETFAQEPVPEAPLLDLPLEENLEAQLDDLSAQLMISLEGMDLLTGDPDPQPVHVYASHPLAKPPLDLPQSAPSVPSQSSAEEEVLSSTASSHSPDNTVQIVWNSSTTLPCKKTPEPPRSLPLPPIKIVDLTISPDSTVKKPSPLELAHMEQKARKEGNYHQSSSIIILHIPPITREMLTDLKIFTYLVERMNLKCWV